MDPNLLPKWRQRRLLCKKKMYGHDFVRHSLSNEKNDNENDNNEGILEDEGTLNYLPNPESYLKRKSTNLPDHTTKEDTDDDRLVHFLTKFLKIIEEEKISDQIASKLLFLFVSYFLPKEKKCPETIEDCRSFIKNRVPEVSSISNEVEEHDIDEG
uniref:BESS domain-containing protein n=1 Tax=Strongyloides papillosus TaxID=174720 RepID=A0A0N5CEW2_STREA